MTGLRHSSWRHAINWCARTIAISSDLDLKPHDQPTPTSRGDVLTTVQMRQAETAHICGETTSDQNRAFAALCLSGGGIRSAAFCLGVLQELARCGLLKQFHYLSTVSGGGFIGGWLQMLIKNKGGVIQAEQALRQANLEELDRLRSYTSYLTPQTGPVSADTWTAVVLYIRNLILNWLVILPLFLILVLIFVAHRTAVEAFGQMAWSGYLAFTMAAILLFAGAYRACLLLPSHRPGAPGKPPGVERVFANPSCVHWGILGPIMAWAVLSPIAVRWFLREGAGVWEHAALPASYVLIMLAAFAAAWYNQRCLVCSALLYRRNWKAWTAATFIAAGLIWLATLLFQEMLRDFGNIAQSCLDGQPDACVVPPSERGVGRIGDQPGPVLNGAQLLTAFAPLLLILCHLVHTIFYVGWRRETDLADLDREWLARLDGLALQLAIGWALGAICCLGLAAVLIEGWGAARTVAVGSVLGAGPAAAWLGKQAIIRLGDAVGHKTVQVSLRWVLNLFSLAFAIGLFATLGTLVQFVLGRVQIEMRLAFWLPHLLGQLLVLVALQLVCAAVLLFVSSLFSQVNVNRFSMHGAYRNRLSRAFLGSGRLDRAADPFTGLGAQENPPLAEFKPKAAKPAAPHRLFPVINVALNLTRSTHTAWAERKAASFTATPLFCGSAALRNPSESAAQPNLDRNGPKGAFVHTKDFAGAQTRGDCLGASRGVGLGSMLTVSGAAVSPNWGYNSSPLTAFLMTLFNVRLGAWAPNPAVATAEELTFASPKDARWALFEELLGWTTDTRQSVYLSDGGHFDNLGLYEMLRRGCTLILVVDAGCDPSAGFADLGNVIRKAKIDGIAVVSIDTTRIASRKAIETKSTPGTSVASGRICYPDGSEGCLVYLKPTYLSEIPADVRAYGAVHEDFPHESTAEQWFTESQFESYRALGAYQMEELAKLASTDLTLAALFAAVYPSGHPSAVPQPARDGQ